MGAANKALKVPPDSVPSDSLASALRLASIRHKGPHFAVLPLGLENLSAFQINHPLFYELDMDKPRTIPILN